jgi:hypothetical protein
MITNIIAAARFKKSKGQTHTLELFNDRFVGGAI